jgi:hypothetical protein
MLKTQTPPAAPTTFAIGDTDTRNVWIFTVPMRPNGRLDAARAVTHTADKEPWMSAKQRKFV